MEGLTNVFAVGDVTNTPEQKLAFLAKKHAAVAAANIAALARGAAAPPKKYAPQTANGALIPIGEKDGVAQVGTPDATHARRRTNRVRVWAGTALERFGEGYPRLVGRVCFLTQQSAVTTGCFLCPPRVWIVCASRASSAGLGTVYRVLPLLQSRLRRLGDCV